MTRIRTGAITILCVLVAVIGVGVGAESYEHAEGGIAFDMPNGWYAQPGAEGDSILVSSADESLAIALWVPQGNTWEAAIEGLLEELDWVIEQPSFDSEGEESELNGMPLYEISGTGYVEGESIEWSVSLILAKKPVIALGFAEPEAWKANRSQLVSFVSSIRKK